MREAERWVVVVPALAEQESVVVAAAIVFTTDVRGCEAGGNDASELAKALFRMEHARARFAARCRQNYYLACS
jgi:hypothetical protein